LLCCILKLSSSGRKTPKITVVNLGFFEKKAS
jgi:hypothetical protein